jgi:chromosome segregation ATPase
MYSSEYVNSLIEENELLKRQKQELIKGGEILRNKFDELNETNYQLLYQVGSLKEENNKLQSMLEEDNNKLIKETERADDLSGMNKQLQNELKKLKSANEYLQKSIEIVKEDLSYLRNKNDRK